MPQLSCLPWWWVGRSEFQLTPQTPLCYCFASKKAKELWLLIPVVLDANAGHTGWSRTIEKKYFILYFL